MEAMIFAAGLGTRLLGETADTPKALVDVGGKPLLQRAIEKLSAAGVSKIVVNVHHFAQQVIDFIESHKWEVPVLISNESGQLLETGGGLKKAGPLFSGKAPILIYNVDIISSFDLQQLKSVHLEAGNLATLVVSGRKSQRYFKFDANMQLAGWINKRSGETKISRPEVYDRAKELAFSGIHMVQPEILNYMPPQDRFSIIEVYLELAKTQKIKGFLDTSELWMDVGKPDELAAARKLFSGQ
ncbi:nucleotidyltransferase family protein [Maribellus sp. CM-23]|uniref:nucleotidyltransferase family protein n=1 Tax=Maribellus sp. CM-23 TaxID=2781026 RepID=UPI001F15E1A0|nr:nucleotidyltransferase family protein [Maribellus sp. CM-23]MCE4562719.1 nucleotidyltransferase family protein [Maribellus sp. CM-23]